MYIEVTNRKKGGHRGRNRLSVYRIGNYIAQLFWLILDISYTYSSISCAYSVYCAKRSF